MKTGGSRKGLTRRTVFWSGVVAIVASSVMSICSHALHVHSKSVNGIYDLIVDVIDVLAIVAIVAGCIAIVVYHWFPDPRRKYSWRLPHRDRE